jgi:hypothetical protein
MRIVRNVVFVALVCLIAIVRSQGLMATSGHAATDCSPSDPYCIWDYCGSAPCTEEGSCGTNALECWAETGNFGDCWEGPSCGVDVCEYTCYWVPN